MIAADSLRMILEKAAGLRRRLPPDKIFGA